MGETAGISIPKGDREVRYLEQVEGDNAVQVRDWTGVTLPLHVVSSGLVLLAHRSSAVVTAYARDGLERYTPRTITELSALRRRLGEARDAGYVWTIEEFSEGISSIAAPILDGGGNAIAAIHVHGPSYRFPNDAARDELQDLIRATANAIEQ